MSFETFVFLEFGLISIALALIIARTKYMKRELEKMGLNRAVLDLRTKKLKDELADLRLRLEMHIDER